MAVISINYDEGSRKKDLGYQSVEISYDYLRKKKVFKSGNFVKDWYDLMKFMITKISDDEDFFVCSSSVDHFRTDGATKLYDPAWLLTKNKPKLVYKHPLLSRNSDPYEDSEDGVKFYVEKGTRPTWEELKEIYDDKEGRGKEFRRTSVHSGRTGKAGKTKRSTKTRSTSKNSSKSLGKTKNRVARKIRKK